jgi:arginyl-tRNA--protein-N-Asp/Glu arginylyltransferase
LGEETASSAWKFHPPSVTSQKLELLNQHRLQRDLALNGVALDESDYRSFLVDTCCPTQEIQYYAAADLLAVAVVDVGKNCLSAVYCYFSPAHNRLSLGTYSILKQIQIAQNTGRQYVYLGMHVAANEHLNYKSRFVPQERLVRGIWQPFDEKS